MKVNKYLNLYEDIKERIRSGEYKEGDKLPSKRVMADMRGVSVITVQQAYAILADEGYIEPRERSGYFVSGIDIFPRACRGDRVIKRLCEPVEHKVNVKFETALWFKTVRKVMADRGDLLFTKSPNKGCEVLRNVIADYLLRYRGMVSDPHNIIIGSGSEQLYETALKVLGREKIYAIEDPSYSKIQAVYRSEGVKIKKLPMGDDGIKSEALNSEFDVLHVTPFNSYPTGVTATAGKRIKYLNRMRGDGYIIEDDWGSEFFAHGQPIESLYSMDTDNRVVYINTFSKSLSPSMRMGYMILPPQLIDVYDRLLGEFSCTVPVLDQYILAEFIASGNFERHLNRMRRKMKEV